MFNALPIDPVVARASVMIILGRLFGIVCGPIKCAAMGWVPHPLTGWRVGRLRTAVGNEGLARCPLCRYG